MRENDLTGFLQSIRAVCVMQIQNTEARSVGLLFNNRTVKDRGNNFFCRWSDCVSPSKKPVPVPVCEEELFRRHVLDNRCIIGLTPQPSM